MSYRREEWTASLAAGGGSIWFVSSMAHESLARYILYPMQPTAVICLATLLWLHAKHLRIQQKRKLEMQLASLPLCNWQKALQLTDSFAGFGPEIN